MSVNASNAVLKGLMWHYKGRSYPSLSPLMSQADADRCCGAIKTGWSGIISQDSTETRVE